MTGHAPIDAETGCHPARGSPLVRAGRPQGEQHARDVDADRADLAARTAEAAGVRQIAVRLLPPERWRQHGTDRTGIHAAVGVAADLLVDGTRVQAGAAPDAVEDFGLLAAEHAAAAVVDEHDVQLVGPVRLLAAPGA